MESNNIHENMKTFVRIIFWLSIMQLCLLAIVIATSAGCIICRIFDIESIAIQILLSLPLIWLAYKMFFAFLNAYGDFIRCLTYKSIQARRKFHARMLNKLKDE